MKEILRDKTFQHPLHPALVHFPIGLFVLSLLLDVVSLVTAPSNDALVRAAFYAMIGGIITAAGAAIPGLMDWRRIRRDHPAKKTATNHMILNFAAVGVYIINAAVRAGALNALETPIFPFILSLLGIGVLSYSGYLGGALVYEDGIAVGRHRRRTATPRETLRISEEAGPGRFVPVASVDSLGEGETMRVDFNGNIITIAKLDGEFHAFQEFCTHRYGPLSEGILHDGQVQCPWHGSCFDVRTGHVTQGPAKEDLKTYEVVVGGNMIQLLCVPAEEAREREEVHELAEAS